MCSLISQPRSPELFHSETSSTQSPYLYRLRHRMQRNPILNMVSKHDIDTKTDEVAVKRPRGRA